MPNRASRKRANNAGFARRRGITRLYPDTKRRSSRDHPLHLGASMENNHDHEETPVVAEQRAQSSQTAQSPPDRAARIDGFFDKVYPLPSYSFFHPASTKQKCFSAMQDDPLTLAICAVETLFSSLSQKCRQVEASQWIRTAEEVIWQHLESPTIPRLQILLLVILFRMETGEFQRAFMLSALAARAATAMRLNHERHDLSPIALEVRRRIMWSIKLVERYFSMGLPEFELCPVENTYLQLPCHEGTFRAYLDEQHSISDNFRGHADDFGSYQFYVKFYMPFPQLEGIFQDFEKDLAEMGTQIHGGPELSADRLTSLFDSPWLPRHILMHLSWHQCHCDLYRLVLSGYREGAPQVVLDATDPSLVSTAEARCLKHALAIIDILANLNQQSTQHLLLEFDTAICAYHSTRLVLFLSRFGNRAELCHTALKRFFSSSLLAKPIIEEIGGAIDAFRSHSAGASRLASPDLGLESRTTIQLSSAARVRQQLAVHSLLRRANFSDEDEGSYSGSQRAPQPGQSDDASALNLRVTLTAESSHGAASCHLPCNQVSTCSEGWEMQSYISGGSGSSLSPAIIPYFEWQDREWLSRGFL
ncbi:hypothetical protein K469DRAFT_742368 [Zopfia rhizophila CBS 207.26]|uniref:Xylanolytic transcriptional activator regulatory domain-containing protein n=1 Tax=Zopfia rhizophila CBS 207.26 TaxID=1314779 RepID=A0A6A6DH25_9PEZI|nr:hypothetical protein K469DRAFT_742368 [Zopfia rhizophila CBS 207.26]